MRPDLKEKIERIIGNNPDTDDQVVISQLEQLIYEEDPRNQIVRKTENITDLVGENLKYLRGGKRDDHYIYSGIESLDNVIGGFRSGEYIIVGGRPGMGKTQLLINLSLNMSMDVPLLYFSFDLSSFLLTNRFISSMSSIPADRLLQHRLTDSQKQLLDLVEEEFSNHRIYINDSYKNSIPAFKDHCKKMIEEKGVKVIIIDSLQTMGSAKYRRHERELEISYISGVLKSIAKDYNVCVIASSQLNRWTERRDDYEKIPRLSDLRDSGAIEQDADKVIFIYRPEYYKITEDERGNDVIGVTLLYIEKNNSGQLGIAKLMRDGEFTNLKSFNHYMDRFTFSPNALEGIKKGDKPKEIDPLPF